MAAAAAGLRIEGKHQGISMPAGPCTEQGAPVEWDQTLLMSEERSPAMKLGGGGGASEHAQQTAMHQSVLPQRSVVPHRTAVTRDD